MAIDIIKAKWKQIRFKSKEWWGKLTPDDLDLVAGSRRRLISKLQERYALSKDQAAKEVNERLKELEHIAILEKSGRKSDDS